MEDFQQNIDGSYFFSSMGRGKEQTTCFIDSRTGEISFEESPKHKTELFEKAKRFLRERKEEKK
jgi:hypothetical protein